MEIAKNELSNTVSKQGDVTSLCGCRYGGAGDIYCPYLAISNCLFEYNSCSANGGALMISSNQLEDGTWAEQEQAKISDCTFRNNTSININGGTIQYKF